MKTSITIDSDEFHLNITKTYNFIKHAVFQAALLAYSNHKNKDYCPYHFDDFIKQTNIAVDWLRGLYPTHDERKKDFERFNKDVCLEEAKIFLATGIY